MGLHRALIMVYYKGSPPKKKKTLNPKRDLRGGCSEGFGGKMRDYGCFWGSFYTALSGLSGLQGLQVLELRGLGLFESDSKFRGFSGV